MDITFSCLWVGTSCTNTKFEYIEKLNEFVDVGQVIGYSMDWCLQNIEDIIISQGGTKSCLCIFYCLMFKA